MFVDWLKRFRNLNLSASVFVVLFWGSYSFGQAQVCDSIYLTPTDLARYKSDDEDLSTFFLTELFPVIEEKYVPNGSQSVRLTIVLVINLNNEVVDVDFPNTNLTSIVLDDLEKKLLEMQGWQVAKHNGIPVCSEFTCAFSCIILG